MSHLNAPSTTTSSSALDAPGPRSKAKIPMPRQYKTNLGHLLYNTFRDKLVPVRTFMKNPTFSEIWELKKNVIIYIEDPEYGALGFTDYFLYNDFNKTVQSVHDEQFVYKTNPYTLLADRDKLFQNYRKHFAHSMTYDALVVTPRLANLSGAVLHKCHMIIIISTLFGIWGCCYAKRKYNPCNKYSREFIPSKKFIFAKILVFSFILAQIFIFISTSLLGFEGMFTNLIDMARHANIHGMDGVNFPYNCLHPRHDIHNQGINTALKQWSEQPDIYKLNMIAVDDFHSSNIVELAIDYIQRKGKS